MLSPPNVPESFEALNDINSVCPTQIFPKLSVENLLRYNSFRHPENDDCSQMVFQENGGHHYKKIKQKIIVSADDQAYNAAKCFKHLLFVPQLDFSLKGTK